MGEICPFNHRNVQCAFSEDSDQISLVMHAEPPPTMSTSAQDDVLADQRTILKQNTDDVEDILKELIRLTTAIRRTGAPSRLQKADGQFDPSAHQELSTHLQVIITAHPSEQITQPFQLGSLQLSEIQWRLIEANLRRRNRFLYQQRHSRKLEIKEKRPPRPSKRMGKSLWQMVKTRILSWLRFPFARRKKTPSPRTTQSRSLEVTRPSPPTENLTVTSASKIQGPVKISKQSPTTVVSSTATKADYPKPPKLAPGQHFFRCPCCCQSLGIDLTQKNRWRFAHRPKNFFYNSH